MRTLPDHLGGGERRCHDDRGALQWAIIKWDLESMIDVGCGQGCVVKDAVVFGLDAMGIDGDPGNLHEDEWRYERSNNVPFVLHDYVEGPAPITREFDLVWSVEFLEHVEEQYMNHYMDTFKKGKYVICTFAPPGKEGQHHVNLQPESYWIKKFDEYGFDFDSKATKELRAASTMKKNFVRERGLVFIQR